jgi:hypothetical protein
MLFGCRSDALGQELLLDCVVAQGQRGLIGLGRFGVAAQAVQEISLRRGQEVMAGEAAVALECLDICERGLRSIDHRYRDRPVERDDGSRPDPQQLPVEREDLRPVGLRVARGLRVERGDGGLQCETSRRTGAERGHDEPVGLGDQLPVPCRPVLLFEPQQPALRICPRGAARLVDEQQREQSGRLAVGWEQPTQHAGQVERAAGEVVAHQGVARWRGVPAGVEQVDDGQHRINPFGQFGARRHGIGNAGGGDLLLGAGQARRHRGLGDEESLGDVRRRQAAYEAQRQGDLRGLGQGRVAAGEDQPQSVVGDRPDVGLGQRIVVGPRSSGSFASRVWRRRITLSALRRATVVSHAPGRSGTSSRAQVRSAWT